jgi:hypothetical protein
MPSMAIPNAGVTISDFESGATTVGLKSPTRAPKTIHSGNKFASVFKLDSIEYIFIAFVFAVTSPLLFLLLILLYSFFFAQKPTLEEEEDKEEEENTVVACCAFNEKLFFFILLLNETTRDELFPTALAKDPFLRP